MKKRFIDYFIGTTMVVLLLLLLMTMIIDILLVLHPCIRAGVSDGEAVCLERAK